MRYLYLDTSSSFLYSGIVEDNKLLIFIKERMDNDLSKITLLKLSQMFEAVSLKPNDIDTIIVVNGPGSFTGIRVGITIAKTYAWGLNKKIITISSLEAMQTSLDVQTNKLPIIDARRNYVYAAMYDEQDNCLLRPTHISIANLLEKVAKLDGDVTIVTNDDIEIDIPKQAYSPDILKIVNKYKNRTTMNPHLVNPEYLKLTEAEEKNIKND